MPQPNTCTHGVDLDQDCRDCEMESEERHKNHKAPVDEEELYEELNDEDDLDDEDEWDSGVDEDELDDEDDEEEEPPFEHPDTGEQKA